MKLIIEFDREEDGRWIAEVLELPGVLAYGNSHDEALAKVQALALQRLADMIAHGELIIGNAIEFEEASAAA
jgi:predicted RNase H-like HicB family nuclease